MTNRTIGAVERAEETSDNPGIGRILVVDDQPEKLLTIEAALMPLGRQVVSVRSGEMALRRLLTDDFAAVLIDVNMPGMDGLETARLIRGRRKNQHTPIIFVTAYGDDIHAVQGYSLGAVDFVAAPFVPEVLRSKVKVFVELYERTEEVERQAQRLLHRTEQLQRLTRASLMIHEAHAIQPLLQTSVDAARELLGADIACVLLAADQDGIHENKLVISPAQFGAAIPESPAGNELRDFVMRLPAGLQDLTSIGTAGPLTRWLPEEATDLARRCLNSPLRSRSGTPIGAILVAGRREWTCTHDDESLLVQLAELTATAIENILFAEAREANRVKDEFLATLSHELRTPLAAILGWVQLLRMQALNPTETSEALQIIENNGQMQRKMIEDLLDVSRIVSGKMRLNTRDIALGAVIQAAIDSILPAVRAKQISLTAALDETEARIAGDPDRLQQAFWNLLSNAVKFTSQSGRIELRVSRCDTHFRIELKDDGEGISPEFLPYVFDRFRQADNSATRRHGGLGIGLSVVRHIVELHGGSIRVESEGRGRGATFVVTLPLIPRDDSRMATTDAESGGEDSAAEHEEPNALPACSG